MFKKILVSFLILGLILPVGSVMAGNVLAKGKPTVTPTPPTDPPPTEIPETGDLYGDLYVILRDENGVPILKEVTLDLPETEESEASTVTVSCIQPISKVDASITIQTYYGELTINAIAGEPFSLASYIDLAGDLVECELAVVIDNNGTPDNLDDDIIVADMTTWVQAVDFGRLNLGRAPDAVIAHGLDEAINKMNSATEMDLDPAGRLMLKIDGEWKTIDAPAENLALYIKMMLDGHWITLDTNPVEPGGGGKGGGGGNGGGGGPPPGDGPSTEPRPVLSSDAVALLPVALQGLGVETRTNADLTNDELLLAASLLAAAADKGGTLTLDSVIYINSIYGINQVGTLPGEVEGKWYFDFRNRNGEEAYSQDRTGTYSKRTSGGCGDGIVKVLQPVDDSYITFTVACVEILAYENSGHDPEAAGVHFTDMVEVYTTVFDENEDPLEYDFIDNVRGFAQASDDALQVIEYIHNYKIPEDLYSAP